VDELTDPQRAVMRRAGLALAAIGLIDVGWCALCVAQGQSYSSSFNIFALGAGVLVYRGSTGAARFVVKGLSFFLGAFLLLPLVMPVLMPPRLLWLQLQRASAGSVLEGVGLYVGALGLLYWIRGMLARVSVHGTGGSAPPLHRSLAAAAGAAIPLFLAVILPLYQHGAAGQRAVIEAEGQAGPGYSFYVQQLSGSRSRGSARVVAYSDTELREVEVKWHDD
jgi:hypothetical protein